MFPLDPASTVVVSNAVRPQARSISMADLRQAGPRTGSRRRTRGRCAAQYSEGGGGELAAIRLRRARLQACDFFLTESYLQQRS